MYFIRYIIDKILNEKYNFIYKDLVKLLIIKKIKRGNYEYF